MVVVHSMKFIDIQSLVTTSVVVRIDLIGDPKNECPVVGTKFLSACQIPGCTVLAWGCTILDLADLAFESKQKGRCTLKTVELHNGALVGS